MHMKDTPLTPILIGLLIGFGIAAVGAFYVFVFGQIQGTAVLQVVAVIATAGFLTALAVVVWRRIAEINEEDPDDYRKY